MRISAKILPLAVAVALWGCQKRTLAPIPQHLSDSLSHASLLTLTHGEGYTLATIADPWHAGHTLQRYVLTDRHRTDSLGELPEGIVIPVPLERAAIFTAAHAQLLCWLHTADKIVGVCDFRYMNIPEMRRQVADGETTDCGDGMAPDVERLRLAAPEAILLSPYEGSNGYGRLTGLGCPIVQCADYMETSPLARA